MQYAPIQSGVEPTLEGPGPFTVFAPTNLAFEKLAQDMGVTVSDLLKLPNLAAILTFHVANGKVLAKDLHKGQEIVTLEGQPVKIKINHTAAYVNGIEIVETDLIASNGVLHIIDGVLLPPVGPPASPVVPQTVVDILNLYELRDLAKALDVVRRAPLPGFWQMLSY